MNPRAKPPAEPEDRDLRPSRRRRTAPPASMKRFARSNAKNRSRWPRKSPPKAARRRDDIHDRYEQIKQSGDTHIAELQRMSMAELIEEARKENLTDYAGIKKQDLIFRILKERVKLNGLMYGEGTLEVLPDGFGFLRSPDYHYLSCPDDIYVSPSQIRRFGLKTGADGFRPDPPAQGKRALLRPAARRGDQLPGPEPAGRQGLLRRTDAAAPRRADPHGDHARRGRDAGGRPDRAHRLRPAGADRQPAAGRQDDPHAEDGQGRADQLSRPLRLHAPDRRAAGRSDRHGAAR